MSLYIELEDNLRLPKSNFIFLEQVAGDKNSLEWFMKAESAYRNNLPDFFANFRRAFESVAVYMDMCYLYLKENENQAKPFDYQKLRTMCMSNFDKYKATMDLGVKKVPYNAKYCMLRYLLTILTDTPERENDFQTFLVRYGFDTKKNFIDNLKEYIWYPYSFTSSYVHIGKNDKEQYKIKDHNLRTLLESFHQFLCTVFDHKQKFSFDMLPVGEYYPVPQEICKKLGIFPDSRQTLYVREMMGKNHYYLGVSESINTSLKDKRESMVIRTLWEESIDDPSNVIRSGDLIQLNDTDSQLQFYSLPGLPKTLSPELVKKLSASEKHNIFRGIAKGVDSLHSCEPPVYHRRLQPDAFLLFERKGRYRVQLVDFRYSKQPDRVDFTYPLGTVLVDLKNQAMDESENNYFAWELRGQTRHAGNSWKNTIIYWEKADIFALGQIWMYLETGSPVLYPYDIYKRVGQTSLSVNEKDLLSDMLSIDPDDRPDIKTILDAID